MSTKQTELPYQRPGELPLSWSQPDRDAIDNPHITPDIPDRFAGYLDRGMSEDY